MNSDILISNGYHKKKISELCIGNLLTQLVKEPTRVTATSSTDIDLIFVTNSEKIIQHGVIKTGITDHYMPFLVRKTYIQSRPPKTILTRNSNHMMKRSS